MIHVLIANPDSAMSKALRFLLQREIPHAVVMEARDVAEMIRALAETPPDVLLLDWNLYGSPAPETCRLLQKAYPHLKLVLLSARESDQPAAQAAGAGFIHKGAEPDELIASLHALLTNEPLQSDTHNKDYPIDQ